MAQDTRKDPRARVLQMTVRYKSATVDEFIEHHSHDVSRGGIFIKTPSPFPAGTLLKFEIRLQDEQAVIAGVGRVVWKREPAQGSDAHPAGMGVKFIKIDEKSKAVITRLVDAQAGAGSAFEAGITDRTDLGEEVPEAAVAATTASAPQAEPAPSKAAQAQVKRASTMLGLGSIGAKGDAGKGEAAKKADAAEGGSFFPQTNPEKEMPPPDERTMMKQAAELLKQALADAGGSLDEIGASKEPLMAAPPKKAEVAPAPKAEHVKPLAEPAAIPVQAVAQLANEREARDDVPAAEAKPAKVAAAKRPAEVADKAPADDLHAKPARQDTKAADDQPKAKPAAAKPKEDKAATAKAAAPAQAPLAQEEESSGTGRILTILLVAAALCGALWLVFGQSDKPPATPPAAPEQPAAKPAAPVEKPQPTEVAPAATDKAAPAGTTAPTATTEAPAAPTATATAPLGATGATAEPATPKATAEPAAPTATAEPAAPKATATAEPAAPTATPEPAAPTATAAPAAPKPAAPRPRPAAPKPPKNDDPYG
ncbi:TIGR02266 family protein [Sorangium sp. So ce375]|uniref:TIGR02266 family protein n=1 Tax=Sorangium sp. So ce375 TaxID=3133306 RepID=UPI003F5BACC8